MNLPNKLTILRMIMIIPFVVFMLVPIGGAGKWIALALFVIASLTDLLDGKIARKYNLVTTFGKFMDPLADKLLVCSALICLVEMGKIPAWIVIIIVSREFIISGFRLVASDKGVVIAAGYWGKFKTTFQMAPLHTFDKKKGVYEGCMPIEVMASRGADKMCIRDSGDPLHDNFTVLAVSVDDVMDPCDAIKAVEPALSLIHI